MRRYELRFKASVQKDLNRLPPQARQRCLTHVDGLRYLPRPPRAAKLEGAERTYRIRVGSYRVVYQVDDAAGTVTVVYVRHRRDAYR